MGTTAAETEGGKKQNFLAIAGIEFTNGVRIIKPGKSTIEKLTGCIPLNGGSGVGKSTLIECLKIATVGVGTRRDNNLIPNGQEETEWLVPIAYVNKPDEILLYIRTVIKQSGEIQQSFMVDTEKGRKTEKNPIKGIEKLTPSKLQDLMRTTLTFGIDDFLSESPTKVREFIFQTYSDELVKLGLIAEKGSPNYAESIGGKIEAAILERDIISRKQSENGAYAVNLEGFIRPMKVDSETLNSEKANVLNLISDEKATIKAKNETISIRFAAKLSELRSKKSEAENIKRDIDQWNNEQYCKRENILNDIFTTKNKLKESFIYFEKIKALIDSENIIVTDAASILETYLSDYYKSLETNVINLPIAQSINLDIEEQDADLPEDAAALLLKLQNVRIEGAAIVKETDAINLETNSDIESELLTKLEVNLQAAEDSILQATETNRLVEKFEILDQFQDAERKVLELRAERNKLYTSINCKVKGLSIKLIDEDKGTMAFTYDGSYDIEYFVNKEKEERLLTSYSASQKILVSVMLQAHLLKQNQLPLNVLYIDNVGMDSKVRDLYDLFAKKNNLMLLVAQTNDKTMKDVGSNELLIEDGEIFYSGL